MKTASDERWSAPCYPPLLKMTGFPPTSEQHPLRLSFFFLFVAKPSTSGIVGALRIHVHDGEVNALTLSFYFVVSPLSVNDETNHKSKNTGMCFHHCALSAVTIIFLLYVPAHNLPRGNRVQ